MRNSIKKLVRRTAALALAAAITAPAALAGTDTGIGIPAGRDSGEATSVASEVSQGFATVVESPVAVAQQNAFDWSDAGIGAATSFVALLLAGAAAASIRRQRGRLSTL